MRFIVIAFALFLTEFAKAQTVIGHVSQVLVLHRPYALTRPINVWCMPQQLLPLQ
uniref:Uncharacterized protein n=1 Tax=Ascaris lumbricoides TaxID=6252 RepID=A0A9J2Q4U5_ASCLU